MAEILLCKGDAVAISDEDKEAARRVIFGIIDGLGEVNRKAWRRFWHRLLKAELGEVFSIITHQQRLGWYHRKHMSLETKVFEAQERFENFEQFRNWIKIGAGHCDWMPGPKGAVVPIPKSISYAKLEQDAMEVFHANVIAFLRTPRACKVLWPKMPDDQRELALEAVLASYGQFAE